MKVSAPSSPAAPDALELGFIVKVRVRLALVILDEASYCGPVRTLRPVLCFYGSISDRVDQNA